MKRFAVLFLLIAASAPPAHAVSVAINPLADAFVSTGPSGNLSGNNYGGGGGISVAAAGLPQGELQSVLKFDLAGAAVSFDSAFGTGQWTLASVALQLTATPANAGLFNTPAAGQLGISWLQNDTWTEGTGNPGSPGASGITYTTLQSTFIGGGDQNLGTFAWSGATSGAFSYALGLTSGLTADALAGALLSLRISAADSSISGVFNSRNFTTVANRPVLTLVAVPEPDSFALLGLGLVSIGTLRRTMRRREPNEASQ